MIAFYSRTSSALQAEAHGVDAQRHAVHEWCTRNGIPAASLIEFVDNGVSGKSMDRPAWNLLMSEIEAGHVKTLIVYSLDRIGRCCGKTIQAVEDIRDKDVRLCIVKDGWDLSTSTGMLMLSIMSAFAEWQRRDISEKSSAGVRARIAKGEKWGGARVKLGKPGGAKVSFEKRQQILAEMFAGARRRDLARRYKVSQMTLSRWERSHANNPPTPAASGTDVGRIGQDSGCAVLVSPVVAAVHGKVDAEV